MEKSVYTTYEVSKICHVTMRAVAEWIDSGKLHAFKTPGGHRRIMKEDLISFLKENNMPFSDEIKDKAGYRVLIVDDEKLVIKLIVRALKKITAEIDISTAMDGFDAGGKILSFKPDLVILDLKLPGIDGFEVCKRVKADPATKNIKILAVTGFPSEENVQKIINYGADGFLSKPFDVNKLTGSVKKMLDIKQ